MRLLAVLLMFAILAGCYASGKELGKAGADEKLFPEFNILLADSFTYINTRNIPEGRPVVLFYFNPNCSYCGDQVAEIVENIDTLKNFRFYFITSFSLSEMKRFIDESEASKYQNITIGCDPTNYLAGYFGAKGGPYMAVFGRDKRLTSVFRGQVYKEEIKKNGLLR